MNPLFVPELFHTVLDFLATSLSDSPTDLLEKRKSFAALARTCHAFSEPSLDHLWRRLDSLLPLIRSFSNVVNEAKFKTSLTPSDWVIVGRYSHRIRELSLGTERLSLHFLQHTELFLPNLRVLKWDRRAALTSHPILFLRLLHSPKIVALEVTLGRVNDSQSRLFLEDFATLCPNLKSIKFDFRFLGCQLPVDPPQSLCRALCGRANWDCIEVSCPIDKVAFRHLGTCPTLKSALLALVPETKPTNEPIFGSEDTPFRNVAKLALTLWDRLEVATHLLRNRDQAFHKFSVILRNTQTAIVEVSALFAAIPSLPRMQSLRSFTFTWVFGPSISPDASQELSFKTLYPLASLVNLRELVVDANYPISIDDNEFVRLVHNWPFLEVFRLTGKSGAHLAPLLSLKALTSLLVSCQNIRDIGISLDARKVPLDESVSVAYSHSVTCLLFQNSPIEDAELVEAFLIKHMPCIYLVHSEFTQAFSDGDRNYPQLWTRVNACLGIRRGGTGHIVQTIACRLSARQHHPWVN